jgi:Ca2+-dependent lipid-binding protein
MGVLTVYLDKVLHLLNDEWLGKASPYVKFELKKEGFLWDKDYGEVKSSKVSDDLNPVYDETFTFNNIPSLDGMELICTVMDDDGILGTDKMGKATIQLNDLGLTDELTGVDNHIDHYWFHQDSRIFLQLAFSTNDDGGGGDFIDDSGDGGGDYNDGGDF